MSTTRRIFLKRLSFGILSVITVGILKLINDQRRKSFKRQVKIALPLEEGINIVDDVIVIRNKSDYRVFSRKCTHLGCSLRRESEDTLICPCHSSQFDSSGVALRGPANKSLIEYKAVLDKESKILLVDVVPT